MPTIALDLPDDPTDDVTAALMRLLDTFGERAHWSSRYGRQLLIVRLDGDEVRRRAYYRLADELCIQQLRSEMATTWRGGHDERKAG